MHNVFLFSKWNFENQRARRETKTATGERALYANRDRPGTEFQINKAEHRGKMFRKADQKIHTTFNMAEIGFAVVDVTRGDYF